MCLICVDISKNKLTVKEARSNLEETWSSLDPDHVYEVLQLLWKKEDEEMQAEYARRDASVDGSD